GCVQQWCICSRVLGSDRRGGSPLRCIGKLPCRAAGVSLCEASASRSDTSSTSPVSRPPVIPNESATPGRVRGEARVDGKGHGSSRSVHVRPFPPCSGVRLSPRTRAWTQRARGGCHKEGGSPS